MDDDISLEPDAIVRTYALFSFARDEKLCVHGAMLSEERAWMQFEAGSKYRWRSLYPLRAIGREDDLRERKLALRDAREKSLPIRHGGTRRFRSRLHEITRCRFSCVVTTLAMGYCTQESTV